MTSCQIWGPSFAPFVTTENRSSVWWCVFAFFVSTKLKKYFIPDTVKPAVLPSIQKDFKSPCLQSAVQGKPSPSKQPSEEPDGQPPAKKKKIDLIFKDVLEASLEDSCKSRSQSSLPSESKAAVHGSEFNSSESNFNVPNLKVEEKEEENQSSEEPSTSFCPNCVKLKRRILELEEELLRLRGEKRDVTGPPMSEQTLHPQDEVPPHPEQGPIEDFQGMSGPKVQTKGFISSYFFNILFNFHLKHPFLVCFEIRVFLLSSLSNRSVSSFHQTWSTTVPVDLWQFSLAKIVVISMLPCSLTMQKHYVGNVYLLSLAR